MFRFGIIAENFEVFENDVFDCKVLWVVGKCEWNCHAISGQCEWNCHAISKYMNGIAMPLANIFCNASLMTMEYVQSCVNCRSTLSMLAGMMNP